MVTLAVGYMPRSKNFQPSRRANLLKIAKFSDLSPSSTELKYFVFFLFEALPHPHLQWTVIDEMN